MRIALVSEHASPLATVGGTDAGGQNVHVASLAAGLGAAGCDVTVYTRRDDTTSPDVTEVADGYRVVRITAGPRGPIPKDEIFAHLDKLTDGLREAWAAESVDIVHSHFWMSGCAAVAAAGPGVPVVHTFHALGAVKRRHQGAEDTSPTERLRLERELLHRVDHVIATCSDEVRELRALSARAGTTSVVPCGVDLTTFWPDGVVEPAPAAGRHRLVVVGRLVERKGVDDVLQALTLLPDVELVVCGGPERARLCTDPEARRLAARAEELGVADRVQLRGRVGREELPALIRSADLVVCAPWYEPFGIVPLEAMGCGVPVVATAVGGLLDTVVDGVTGVHVPPRAPDRLAAAVDALLADPRRRAHMGRAAVRRARLYSWPRVAAATLGVYERVLRREALDEVVSR